MTVRVLLVEDDPMWQQGVQALLGSDPRFELVGVADHYEEALARFQEQQPQVVLLDWKIKGNRDGLAVGEHLLALGVPSEHLVLISGSEPSIIPSHPFLFVPKSRLANELLPLLESVTIH